MFSYFDFFYESMFDSSEWFLTKEYKEEMQFNILQEIDFQNRQEQEAKEKQKEKECNKCSHSSAESTRPRVSLADSKAITDDDEHDDDGFKTPTSLDHKIPEIKQCPPAPKKQMFVSSSSSAAAKRKASRTNVRRSLQLDLCEEVESLFPRPILGDLYNRKIKRARRDDDTPVN